MPMALRDKLNSLAAEAASKANTAIENGKLSLKIMQADVHLHKIEMSGAVQQKFQRPDTDIAQLPHGLACLAQ